MSVFLTDPNVNGPWSSWVILKLIYQWICDWVAGPSLGPHLLAHQPQASQHISWLCSHTHSLPLSFHGYRTPGATMPVWGHFAFQIYLLPLLFGSIMQRSDSTESACSSSFSYREAPGGDGRMGGGREKFLYSVSGASPWWLSLLRGSRKCETGPALLLPRGHWRCHSSPVCPSGGGGFLLLGLLPTSVFSSSSITWVSSNP